MTTKKIDSDKALIALGDYGKYQLRIWICVNIPSVFMAMQILSMAFVNAKPNFFCASKDENYSFLFEYLNNDTDFKQTCGIRMDGTNNSIPCGSNGTRFVYDESFGNTIVTEVPTSNTDTVYNTQNNMCCLSFYGMGMVGHVISCETVNASWRAYSTLLGCITWSVGYMALGVLAYFVRDWRQLSIYVAIPAFVGFAFYWYIPETLRWLVANGHNSKAELWIAKAAKYNKIKVDSEKIYETDTMNARPTTKRNIFHIFRSKLLAKYTVILAYLWICNSFVYYGLSLFSTRFSGDRFVNFILSGFVEIPAYFTAAFTLEKCGRRVTTLMFHLMVGLALLIFTFVPTVSAQGVNLIPLRTTLWLTGKFAISCTFQAIFLYSAELYPTTVRNVGCGLLSTAGRIGAILAPYVGILAETNPAVPLAVFFVMSFVAAGLTIFLPETRGAILADDIDDVKRRQSRTFTSDPATKTNQELVSLTDIGPATA